MELQDCIEDVHLKKLDSNIKKNIAADKNRKCVDLTKANISGGTEYNHTEHVVIMSWQHCERFKPANECANKEDKKRFF